MARQYANRLAMIAFATINLGGLLENAGFESTIRTALVVGAAFFGLGLVAGELARLVVEENVRAEIDRLAANSVPANT